MNMEKVLGETRNVVEYFAFFLSALSTSWMLYKRTEQIRSLFHLLVKYPMFTAMSIGYLYSAYLSRLQFYKMGYACLVWIIKKIWINISIWGNCPPTPPLTQQQLIDNKFGLMLG